MGMTMWPHLFNRAYAARTDDALKKSIMLFPLYSLLILPVLLVGFAGILIIDSLDNPDQIMFELIAIADISPWLIGIVLSGALAASMSTGANVLHTIASIVVKDLYLNYVTIVPECNSAHRDKFGQNQSSDSRKPSISFQCPSVERTVF